MFVLLLFHTIFLLVHSGMVFWDCSIYGILFGLNDGVFDSCECMPKEGYFRRICGRWRYFTVWTMDINLLQSIDGFISACRGSFPNPCLQYISLVTAFTVVPGVLTMPPFTGYNEDHFENDNLAKKCRTLGRRCHFFVFSIINIYVHAGVAIVAVLQMYIFRHPDAPALMSMVGGMSFATLLAINIAWAVFTELVTKTWARYEWGIGWPYGEQLTRAAYVLFPIGSATVTVFFKQIA